MVIHTISNIIPGNNLDQAVDAYFNATPTTKPPPKTGPVDNKKLDALFNTYKDTEDITEDLILVDGTIAFFNDILLDPTHVTALVIAYHLECERMWYAYNKIIFEFKVNSIEKGG